MPYVTKSPSENGREIYIDLLRIFACFMVIFNHTNERGFYRFSDLSIRLFPINFSVAFACKVAVPIFFMISGALLLGKQESIVRTYARIPKILVDLLLFSFIYRWVDCILGGREFSLKVFAVLLVREGYWHLWYLYAYIIFLITLPFLRKMVQSLDRQSSLCLFILASLTMAIPPVVTYFWGDIFDSMIPTWITGNIFIYPVMGYAADRIFSISDLGKKHFSVLWTICLVGFLISYRCQRLLLLREPELLTEMFLTNFSLVYAVTLFLTIKKIFYGKRFFPSALCHIITQLGQTTYAVYLLHILFLWKIPFFTNLWESLESFNGIASLFGVYFSCLGVFVVCSIVGLLFRRTPIIRRLF